MTTEQFEMLKAWAGPRRSVEIRFDGVKGEVDQKIWLYDYGLKVGFHPDVDFTVIPDFAEIALAEKREQLAKLKAELGE
jgi:hypothetical protein